MWKSKSSYLSYSLVESLPTQLQKPFDCFIRSFNVPYWLAHLLVEIPCGFELVISTAIIDHSNMLKQYMEVLILSVLHVPQEKHPTENGVIAGKL